MRYRRFGKTELRMPVISCGGMRFQQPFGQSNRVTPETQKNVEACVHRALELGITHIETARGYPLSEEQLGKVLPQLPRDGMIVQTKIVASPDPKTFADTFEESMRTLNLDYIDLLGFHGINNDECLEHAMRCMDQAQAWKREGRVRHIGFSTHAPTDVLVRTIETDAFEYVNLHWYYIFQDNWPAVEAATAHDMGVFIISPNDKGGMLYLDNPRLARLTEPLHPMVFNGLFCLARPEVHTLSCGVAQPEDFDIHMETVEKADQAAELAMPIAQRLDEEMARAVGQEWAETWHVGLPEWWETPGNINIPVILRLRNLALAYDMVEYGKMRYNLLGNAGHWFPGENASKLNDYDLTDCLAQSPHRDIIPDLLAETHAMLVGEERKRLQADE